MEVIRLKPFPWIVPDAIPYLDSLLSAIDSKVVNVVETGSGGSTLWLAKRTRRLISFEHNRRFYNAVKKEIACFPHAEIIHDPKYPKRGLPKLDFRPDLAFIDGRGRVKSILTIWPQISKGGYLILDNSNRPKYRPALKILEKEAESIATFKYNWKLHNQWTTSFFKK